MQGIQQALAVLTVLALLGALVWVLRRRGLLEIAARGRARYRGLPFEVVQRVPLTPQHSLHLVRLAGHAVLVAVSPGGCTAIDTFDWSEIGAPEDSPESRGPSGSLRSRLHETQPRAGYGGSPETAS